jgi:hypothetical protein
VHFSLGCKGSAALEAAPLKSLKDIRGKIVASLILIAQLWAATVKVFKEQFKMSPPCCVFLHLAGGALRIVRSINLEFLAESTFQLEAIFKLGWLAGVSIEDPSKRCVTTRTTVGSDTVVAIAQMSSLVYQIDRQEAATPVARLERKFFACHSDKPIIRHDNSAGTLWIVEVCLRREAPHIAEQGESGVGDIFVLYATSHHAVRGHNAISLARKRESGCCLRHRTAQECPDLVPIRPSIVRQNTRLIAFERNHYSRFGSEPAAEARPLSCRRTRHEEFIREGVSGLELVALQDFMSKLDLRRGVEARSSGRRSPSSCPLSLPGELAPLQRHALPVPFA